MTQQSQRLVILSGPSCAGKGPLVKALARFYPRLAGAMQPLVLYNSRAARPGEHDGIDYHFRSRAEVENLRNDKHFLVLDARGDLQAIDLQELAESLAEGDVLFEGNPIVGRTLLTHPSLAEVTRLSIFMSPLSRAEVVALKDAKPTVSLPELVTEVMRRKLLRRTRRLKGEISLRDLENIENRASCAYGEMRQAHLYQHVIPNHDGEDSGNWDAFYHPLGDARSALLMFASLLEGKVPDGVESWEENLIP